MTSHLQMHLVSLELSEKDELHLHSFIGRLKLFEMSRYVIYECFPAKGLVASPLLHVHTYVQHLPCIHLQLLAQPKPKLAAAARHRRPSAAHSVPPPPPRHTCEPTPRWCHQGTRTARSAVLTEELHTRVSYTYHDSRILKCNPKNMRPFFDNINELDVIQ